MSKSNSPDLPMSFVLPGSAPQGKVSREADEPNYEPDAQDFADLAEAEAAFAAGDYIDHQEMMVRIEARIEAISAERSRRKPSP